MMPRATRRQFLASSAALAVSGPLLNACGSNAPAAAAADGWYMPAEEHPHTRTWMCWPSRAAIWGSALPGVQADIARIATAINEFEPVTMLVRASAQSAARRAVGSQVALEVAPVDDLWARDTLPLFLIDDQRPGKLAAGSVRFNGWGNKQIHAGDSQLSGIVAEMLGIPRVPSRLYGEGGGLEVDGHGTVLASRSSWVNRNRNPGLSERQIAERLIGMLGAERLIWVDGIAGEDITDGHIDTLARFVDPGTLMLENTAPGDDSIWRRTALKTRRQLASVTTLEGKPYDVATLQQPSRLPSSSENFLASYVNYLVCNGAVIAPAFGDKRADDRARGTLAEVYPNREVVQLRIDGVASGGGGIHCATQQQPKAA
jgi:agmatine deiminase